MIQTKFSARIGLLTISTPNNYLDGQGTVEELIKAGENGTLIKHVIIKAQNTTSLGMIRFFLYDGSGYPKLIQEVPVSVVKPSGRDYSFYRIIPFNLNLAPDTSLMVSSETGDVFNLITEVLDWSYASSYTEQSIEFQANTGFGLVYSANPYRDGSGSMEQVLEAGSSSSGFKGTLLTALIVKAQQNVNNGMVRIFLETPSYGRTLFSEIAIPYFEYSATTKSFIFKAPFSLTVQPDTKIYASTENDEKFTVMIEALDWSYLNS